MSRFTFDVEKNSALIIQFSDPFSDILNAKGSPVQNGRAHLLRMVGKNSIYLDITLSVSNGKELIYTYYDQLNHMKINDSVHVKLGNNINNLAVQVNNNLLTIILNGQILAVIRHFYSKKNIGIVDITVNKISEYEISDNEITRTFFTSKNENLEVFNNIKEVLGETGVTVQSSVKNGFNRIGLTKS